MNVFKAKSDQELSVTLGEKREEIRVMRFGTAGSKNRDVRAQRKARRDVARVLTEQKVRSMSVPSK